MALGHAGVEGSPSSRDPGFSSAVSGHVTCHMTTVVSDLDRGSIIRQDLSIFRLLCGVGCPSASTARRLRALQRADPRDRPARTSDGVERTSSYHRRDEHRAMPSRSKSASPAGGQQAEEDAAANAPVGLLSAQLQSLAQSVQQSNSAAVEHQQRVDARMQLQQEQFNARLAQLAASFPPTQQQPVQQSASCHGRTGVTGSRCRRRSAKATGARGGACAACQGSCA